MANLYGSHFEYGGVSSRQYGLIIANVETERFEGLAGTISGSTVFSRIEKKNYLIDTDYSNYPLSFEIDIVIDDDERGAITNRREVEQWLFNRHAYQRLYLDRDDDCFGETYELVDGAEKRLYLNCRFINPQKLEYNDGVVGYRCTIEVDTGMWWQDEISQSFPLNHAQSSSTSVITVNCDSDLDEYIYPKVTIVMGNVGGDVIITNNTDDSSRYTSFVGLPTSATVTLRGGTNYISGNYYMKFAYKNFPRLLPGENNITVLGNVSTITYTFSNRRAF